VEKGYKGEKKNIYPIAFKAEVKPLEWLDNNFIGKTMEPSKAKDLKVSFILGGFNFIRVRYLGGNCVLMSIEDANLIKKSIDENKEWFESIFETIIPWEHNFMVTEKKFVARIRGLPLNLWSGQSLESIVSMVGTLVEIDKYTLEVEELEYGRVLIKLHVAKEARWEKCMKINGFMCQIAIEEEPVINVKYCYNGDWENSSNDDEFRSNLGTKSEGSEIGRNLKFHGGFGEETTVEELLRSESRRSDAAAEVRGDDVEGQQLSGLQNTRRFNEAIDGLGGQFERSNKVIDEVEEEPRQFNFSIKEAGG